MAASELKFHDGSISVAPVTSTGTIAEDSLLTIASGTGESERVGRKLSILRIRMRYLIEMNAQSAAAAAAEAIRVIVYLDKQANGAAATVADIMEADDLKSYENRTNRDRFELLYDRQHVIETSGAVLTTSTVALSQGFVDLQAGKHFLPIPVEYSSTSGVITEMTSKNVGVLLLADAGDRVDWNARFRVDFVG